MLEDKTQNQSFCLAYQTLHQGKPVGLRRIAKIKGCVTSLIMTDLKSKKLIIVKGILFLIIALCSFVLILIQLPSWNIVLLLLCLVWAACRFYYFLFYVLEKYVDSSLRYAGILALIQAIWRRS